MLCRLVPGGLAESTGLLAVNDEVLEVNGIEVAGKSLDQVRASLRQFRICASVEEVLQSCETKVAVPILTKSCR